MRFPETPLFREPPARGATSREAERAPAKTTALDARDSPTRAALAAPCAEDDAQIVRVTTQYWRGDARVCELECDGRVLDIHMSRSNQGLWRAEAHSDHTVEAFVLGATGTSRSAALQAVAAAWREQAPVLGLERFDWEGIANALRGVSACD